MDSAVQEGITTLVKVDRGGTLAVPYTERLVTHLLGLYCSPVDALNRAYAWVADKPDETILAAQRVAAELAVAAAAPRVPENVLPAMVIGRMAARRKLRWHSICSLVCLRTPQL